MTNIFIELCINSVTASHTFGSWFRFLIRYQFLEQFKYFGHVALYKTTVIPRIENAGVLLVGERALWWCVFSLTKQKHMLHTHLQKKTIPPDTTRIKNDFPLTKLQSYPPLATRKFAYYKRGNKNHSHCSWYPITTFLRFLCGGLR